MPRVLPIGVILVSSDSPLSNAVLSRRLLLAVFAVSGASGLVYQVVWMRRLSLVFGSTTLAISTVLVSFMGGLALGSRLLGRYADRHPDRALRTYGLLELGIGAYALCIPLLLRGAGLAYLRAYPALEGNPQVFLVLQFFLVSAVLILPTAFMGGTLPLLVRYSVHRRREVGNRVGALYAANTFGAAGGVLLSTYALLPYLGVARSELAAAAANLCVGAVALFFASRGKVFDSSRQRLVQAEGDLPRVETAPSRLPAGRTVSALLLGLALSGFAAFTYEVVWSRVLAFVLGSSVYAFGMVLLVFLLGIAGGSVIFSRLRPTAESAVRMFAIAQAGLAAAGLLAFDRLPELPALFLRLFPVARASFLGLQLVQLLVVAALLLLPALLFGVAFPSVIAATADSAEQTGKRVGQAMVWNTIGNVAGAFLAGFFLIPRWGLSTTFVAAIAASGLAALVVVAVCPTRGRALVMLAAAGSVVVALLLPPWPSKVLASGVGFFAADFGTPDRWREAVESLDLLFYKDGVSTTISVDRSGPYIFYRSNGKTDASTAPGDLASQLYLGYLPMFLHSQPQDVFVLGLGTGVTAASVARFPVQSIDIVDIEPASREASGFFVARNRNVLADPRVRLILADGRNALLARPKTYDVIISDPSDVWVAGIGNLFTREFYNLARSRLRPGGVMVQWFHLHSLPPEQLRLLVATFQSVFPHATLWHTNRDAVLLTGTVEPVPWNFQRLDLAFRDVPGVAQDFGIIGLRDPISIFAALLLSEAEVKAYVAGVRELHSDDRPVIEYFSPRALYADTARINDRELQSRQRAVLPIIEDVKPDWLTSDAIYHLGVGYFALGRTERGLRLLEEAVRADPNAGFLAGLGEAYVQVGRQDAAADAFGRALRANPRHSVAAVGLAALLQRQSRPAEAEAVLREGLRQNPDDPSILEAVGRFLSSRRNYIEALPLFQRALEKTPRNASLALLTGQSFLALRKPSEARPHLLKALEFAPANPGLQCAAGQSLLELGDAATAAAAFAKAVAMEPRNREALLGLSEAARQVGDKATAASAQERLRRTPASR